MATVKKHSDFDRDITVLTVMGVPTAGELIGALEDFYSDKPTLHLLFDFTHADLRKATSNDMKAIIESVIPHTSKRKGGRTALVSSEDYAYGLTRMYSTLSSLNGHPIIHRLFRSVEEAHSWLLEIPANTSATS